MTRDSETRRPRDARWSRADAPSGDTAPRPHGAEPTAAGAPLPWPPTLEELLDHARLCWEAGLTAIPVRRTATSKGVPQIRWIRDGWAARVLEGERIPWEEIRHTFLCRDYLAEGVRAEEAESEAFEAMDEGPPIGVGGIRPRAERLAAGYVVIDLSMLSLYLPLCALVYLNCREIDAYLGWSLSQSQYVIVMAAAVVVLVLPWLYLRGRAVLAEMRVDDQDGVRAEVA